MKETLPNTDRILPSVSRQSRPPTKQSRPTKPVACEWQVSGTNTPPLLLLYQSIMFFLRRFPRPNGCRLPGLTARVRVFYLPSSWSKGERQGVPRKRSGLLWRDALCLHRSQHWCGLLRWWQRDHSKGRTHLQELLAAVRSFPNPRRRRGYLDLTQPACLDWSRRWRLDVLSYPRSALKY